ncbi:MotA/TolQ/ExbB proton channel family protein [Rhodocyclus tenuis]|uniref:Biopolymer transport protein ExbB n=1 Tax=Rhodocyclus tenuis TaxID=1066 RepID=A0A840G762_RHOTE|nr:MotA/TolQ/ExbB proton channel family protein [Rhodocyclus tenuis]MBB4247716.1 biopolymer transport protein ExbB [Rhodocyclus tenuis]MBK1680989.1 biopolymer transporter ExbB [Rhodocyclus tenuis]
MESSLGLSHFLSQTDWLAKGLLAILSGLSIACWTVILLKGLDNVLGRRREERFVARFWQAASLTEAAPAAADNAFARLAHRAVKAVGEIEDGALPKLAQVGGPGEYLSRALRNGIDQESTRVDQGLTILASAASSAPYLGLFGTVWGIYHALVGIGLSGQGTLDKVAGPVGEALIMTALGLAVAIPAALAHNAFSRRNQVWLGHLEAFAHDLYALAAGSRNGGR